jgi:hypothetical protein
MFVPSIDRIEGAAAGFVAGAFCQAASIVH